MKKRVAGSIMAAFGGGAKEPPGSGPPKKKGLVGKMFGGKAKGK